MVSYFFLCITCPAGVVQILCLDYVLGGVHPLVHKSGLAPDIPVDNHVSCPYLVLGQDKTVNRGQVACYSPLSFC